MKSSIVFLVFFALCAVTVAASTKQPGRARGLKNRAAGKNTVELNKQGKALGKTDEFFFDAASAKAAVDATADALNSAFERMAPLAKEGVALSGEVYQRLRKGPSKEGRALDAQLTQRMSDYAKDARSAAADFFAAAKAAASSSFFAQAAKAFSNAYASFSF